MDERRCRQWLGELSAYLDGELAQELCAELERHLQDCPDCQVVVDTLARTVTLYRVLPAPGLPDGARQRLFHRLHLDSLGD
ncbi:zf-HC2 domain-containing protein [Litorilinea aerophila]|uniref:Putative zinc-finger domain-containing protein n=1 Tax=Litorilinea aerophila TaxID=1204385 RepID=A0A540VDR6_9CHLR|nr:zf-HC2 domain-containing protein [Litorilinea aerophila]MCC9077419.1 zf-HC2 domain-containing protein [Litorilinea aerophila]OUC06760.1 hypothetical protein RY27_19045 [Litorilinea aerophila]